MWFRTTRTIRRTPASTSRGVFRPLLEALEARTVPSVTMIKDINPTGDSNPALLTPVGSWLYFVADDGTQGPQVWRTNGRPGGTVPVDGASSFDSDGFERQMTPAGLWVYFLTTDGAGGYELWRNDSRTEASQALHAFSISPDGLSPADLTAVGQDVYFVAYTDSVTGYELWKVDGSTGATAPFKDIRPGPDLEFNFGGADMLTAVGSDVYFNADDGINGPCLWRSDGTTGGTAPVPDAAGGFAPLASKPTAVGTDLYYLDTSPEGNPAPFGPQTLMRVPGPTAAAHAVQSGIVAFDSYTGFTNNLMTAVGGDLYFISSESVYPFDVTGFDLWKCVGDSATMIQSFPNGTNDPGTEQVPVQIVGVGSSVYLADEVNVGDISSLWVTDGTPGNASLLHSAQSKIGWMTPAGSTLYFVADGLWQTEGTAASTQHDTTVSFDSNAQSALQGPSLFIPSPYFFLDGRVPFPLAEVGSTLYFGAGLNPAAGLNPNGINLWRLNTPPVANPDAYAVNENSTLTLPASAGVEANDTDADDADVPNLTASPVTGPAHGGLTLNSNGSFTYTPAAGYVGPDNFTYQISDGIDPSNVATVSLAVRSLQDTLDALPTSDTLTVQATTPEQAHDIIAAANGLDPATTPTATVVVDLGGQTVQDTTVNVPPQVTLTFVNGTFIGGSPALIVSSGNVVVSNSLFTNGTKAPTILISGGSLTLRNSIVQESTGFNKVAIQITGGTVDLGTATDPGGNTLNVNGNGSLIQNTGANPVSAIGNLFEVNGAALTSPYQIADLISDALDTSGDGLVTFVANNVFVTPRSGSIQRGVDAVAAGGTINVEAGHFGAFTDASKLLTVSFQGGPTVSLEQDPSIPSLADLYVKDSVGGDSFAFTPGSSVGQITGTITSGTTTMSLGAYTVSGAVFVNGAGDVVTVKGTSGNDAFALSDSTAVLNGMGFNLAGIQSVTLDGLGGADSFVNNNSTIASVLEGVGGSDTFTFAGTSMGAPAQIVSGAGNNTLVAPNMTNVWTLIGSNAGTLNGDSFSGIHNLIGGASPNDFVFSDGAGVTGDLDAGAGTLDYSKYTTSVSIDLQKNKATGIGGTATNLVGATGGTGNNSLTGANTDNIWNISGNNAGNINSTFAFAAFATLTGGSGNDYFAFSAGGNVTGAVNGKGGTNRLEYSAYSAAVYVNLLTGVATGSGGITNFRQVYGSGRNDVLVGNGAGVVLAESAGKNLIIGGTGGQATLDSGSGDDIVIAGSTIFDNDPVALQAIENYWSTNDGTFGDRVAALSNGIAGGYQLNSSTVKHHAGNGDTIILGSADDWLFWRMGNSAGADLLMGIPEQGTPI